MASLSVKDLPTAARSTTSCSISVGSSPIAKPPTPLPMVSSVPRPATLRASANNAARATSSASAATCCPIAFLKMDGIAMRVPRRFKTALAAAYGASSSVSTSTFSPAFCCICAFSCACPPRAWIALTISGTAYCPTVAPTAETPGPASAPSAPPPRRPAAASPISCPIEGTRLAIADGICLIASPADVRYCPFSQGCVIFSGSNPDWYFSCVACSRLSPSTAAAFASPVRAAIPVRPMLSKLLALPAMSARIPVFGFGLAAKYASRAAISSESGVLSGPSMS